jgi:predicted DNA-binding transcriptional regulator AlpA
MSVMASTAPDRLLKMSDVKARTNLSPATIYRWLKQERFPEPIRYSETCVRWRESDIDEWIAGKAPPKHRPSESIDGAH